MIFNFRPDCQKQIDGFKAAKFKKFPTKEEAQSFIDSDSKPTKTTSATTATKRKSIIFTQLLKDSP